MGVILSDLALDNSPFAGVIGDTPVEMIFPSRHGRTC
jgi:hypothetical protein